jgi:hypothetical protein
MAIIDRVDVLDHRLDPAEAEIWITVVPHWESPTATVRGRLVGPRCQYSSTVEVGYLLRPVPRPPEGLVGLTMRVNIPEPSLWDPESPFLYQGPVELLDESGPDQIQVRLGLCSMKLGPRGFLLNSRPLSIRGKAREPLSDQEALRLRQTGCNLLLAPHNCGARLWELADRLGFLVLGRLEPAQWGDLALLRKAEHQMLRSQPGTVARHPSCFGWLITEDALANDPFWWKAQAGLPNFLGVELNRPPSRPLPKEVQFVVCQEKLHARLTEVHRPKILLVEKEPPLDTRAGEARVLGWIAD